MSTREPEKEAPVASRRRLTRQDRRQQLIEVAWCVVRDEGTDALSLGRLSERAGVTKPVVYDHFATRAGLLAALYEEFDLRHMEIVDAAIATAEPNLKSLAAKIAAAYVDCVLTQGREIPDLLAALASLPELDRIKRQHDAVFRETCRRLLLPYAGRHGIADAGLWAMLGAAEALSRAAASGDLDPGEAKAELAETIKAMTIR